MIPPPGVTWLDKETALLALAREHAEKAMTVLSFGCASERRVMLTQLMLAFASGYDSGTRQEAGKFPVRDARGA